MYNIHTKVVGVFVMKWYQWIIKTTIISAIGVMAGILVNSVIIVQISFGFGCAAFMITPDVTD
jgi:hypothetical protein